MTFGERESWSRSSGGLKDILQKGESVRGKIRKEGQLERKREKKNDRNDTPLYVPSMIIYFMELGC